MTGALRQRLRPHASEPVRVRPSCRRWALAGSPRPGQTRTCPPGGVVSAHRHRGHRGAPPRRGPPGAGDRPRQRSSWPPARRPPTRSCCACATAPATCPTSPRGSASASPAAATTSPWCRAGVAARTSGAGRRSPRPQPRGGGAVGRQPRRSSLPGRGGVGPLGGHQRRGRQRHPGRPRSGCASARSTTTPARVADSSPCSPAAPCAASRGGAAAEPEGTRRASGG